MQMRQERTATLKRLRQSRANALAAVADKIENERIRRDFEAAERKFDAALRRFHKRVRVQPEPRRRAPAARKRNSTVAGTGHSGLVLKVRNQAPSALARRDRAGCEGIMLRIRYVRAGGQHAKIGCVVRHWRYIAREAAVTLDADGEPILLGNLGDAAAGLDAFIEQVADGLAVQEKVLRAMRKNAKLSFRMVGAFPYGLPVEARREVLQRIGDEVFGARGLGWSAAAHDTDPSADVDNDHFHLDYTLLPMERQADGSYIVSNELRTDLDGQEGLRFIRHQVARVLTEVAREHRLDRTFTALSYRERGMDREGGEHVGQQGTAAQRQGHHVAAVARNEARRRRDDARERARAARERLTALEELKQAIEREAARVPSLPALPDIVATDATPLPVVSAMPDLTVATDVDPVPPVAVPEDVPVFPLSPEVPHIPAVPQTAFDLRPVSVPSIPPASSLTAVPTAVSPGAPMPILSRISIAVAAMREPPTLSGIGKAPPILLRIRALHDIGSPAPTFEVSPGLTYLAENAPMIPAVPGVYHIGTAVPNMPSPRFELRNLGTDIARDAEDEAIGKDLRAAVERETIRRREVASDKPLDPFSGVPDSKPHPEFEELLALLEKQPELLTVHEGQMFPGDALPARLRKALQEYALHPRARAMMVATLARDHEFSFLDHALKSGDSLVGLSRAQIEGASWETNAPPNLWRLRVSQDVDRVLAHREAIRNAPDEVALAMQEAQHAQVERGLENVRLIGDAVIASFFAEAKPKPRRQALADVALAAGGAAWDRLRNRAIGLEGGSHPVRPFHWEIEFPEVFSRDNPGFDAIIGNPPFLGGTWISGNFGVAYAEWLSMMAEGCGGRADLSAYFFRRTFGLLRQSGAMGLIATNTIRQGDTREGGLQKILANGGRIVQAIRRMQWPGEAAVVISTITISKTDCNRSAVLDGSIVSSINSFLVEGEDKLGIPFHIFSNAQAFKGYDLYGMGFVFSDKPKGEENPLSVSGGFSTAESERLKVLIGGEDINQSPVHDSIRFAVNVNGLTRDELQDRYPNIYSALRCSQEPYRQRLAPGGRNDRLRDKWWVYNETRPGLTEALLKHDRVLCCSQVSPHLAIAARSSSAIFLNTVIVFTFATDAALAALQSRTHELWVRFFASSMKDDLRYTPSDCFETFPLPPGFEDAPALETAGQAYHDHRAQLMITRNQGMTPTYNRFHDAQDHAEDIVRLRELHAAMDCAVLAAYGWDDLAARAAPEFLTEETENDHTYQSRLFWPAPFRDELLARLLRLNEEFAEEERLQAS